MHSENGFIIEFIFYNESKFSEMLRQSVLELFCKLIIIYMYNQLVIMNLGQNNGDRQTGKNFNRQAAKLNIDLLRGDTAPASQ